MAGEMVQDEPAAGVLSWYDRTRPMWIDLVGDYAGKELFLVEGDSLLRECFEDERIDFAGGFQILHAVYVVERFLEDLIKRHCQFHIAFFEENSQLCIPPGVSAEHEARYLLARSVIKRHLTRHLPSACPNVVINTFPALESAGFSEYLNSTPVYFVMTHDGSRRESKKSETSGNNRNEKVAKASLRTMIWWFNTNGLNAALINRIEFRDSKVFTMIVESFTASSKLKLAMAGDLIKRSQAAKQLLKGSSVTEALDKKSTLEPSVVAKLAEAFSEEDLSESYFLAIYGVSKILRQGDSDVFMASAFILHSVIIKNIPLSQRRLPLITFDEDFEEEVDEYITRISNIFKFAVENPKWNELMDEEEIETDAIDLIDGRLFRVVIQAMCDTSFDRALPKNLQPDWKAVSALVKELSGQELSLEGSTEPESSETTATEADLEKASEDLAVLAFSNPVFDKHLECIHVKADASLPARMGALKIYRETSHWHNHKKPLNPKYAPAAKVSKWRNPLRTNQFYMNEMTSYAASLTGAKGKALDAETITVGPKVLNKVIEEKPEKPSAKSKKEEQEAKAINKKGAAKKGTKAAVSQLSKKDQMIADNKERKGGNEADKALNAWSMVMKGIDVIPDDQDRYIRAMKYLNGLDSAKSTYLEAEVYTYILQSLLTWWSTYCKAEKKPQGYHVVALIWTTIRSICTSKAPVSKEIVLIMTKICTLLGITDALTGFEPTPIDRKLSFNFKFPVQTQNLRIVGTQAEFQLNYCGPYMDRMLDAKPDPRVSSFVPDGWQRDVLDQLDSNKSVFVVAPTSAGKTFISFYAMEQVLRAGNDGVLVYVAPTKALVNQIAAEVQGRFSKKFPVPGKGVWAIHTRDYRVNNSTGCQILVTVPHILQIMLLSPSNANSWSRRVSRIVFDEIHSIGNAEDGVVWEQLLLLAPCPIIALSATVGNPGQFNDWLTETQKASGTEMKMIQHGTRYSDLRKYMYDPPKSFRFSGLGKSFGVGLGLDGLVGFNAFHPAASLVDKSRGMPDDLAFEPRDCLTLWKAMVKFQTPEYPVPASLHPEKALPACVRKADIFTWEKSLKKVLVQWMASKTSPFDKVVEYLSIPAPIEAAEQVPSSTASTVTDADTFDPLDLKCTTLPLLFQLHKRRALPAILFNYDRNQCEEIAASVLKQLVDAETQWKEGPAWKKLMDGYEEYKEMKDKKGKKPAKPVKKTKDNDDEGGSKMDRMREESSDGASKYDLFDPEAPQAEFSFANPKQLQKAELDEYVRSLRWKHIREELIELLKRGIGVHHAGMNRKYRQCVEMLFRKGFLRVVIATGTLSLGINMPCATVVFSGDSVFLTALNFRQAAGRSGRRGFDLLGNVVFQGLSEERASRLLSSRLPDMTGHFPITTTLVLRLFTLLNDSKSSPYAVKAINSLLSQPRLYLGGQSFKEQVLHHLRFSIEYLRRNELLGPLGEPVNFTSCVSHLYFTENSSFAFHALLKGGYFHVLCEDIDTKTDMVLQKMILVLSHLFGRRVTREVDNAEEAEKIKRSPSIVYLPEMPEDAAKILRTHNKDTLDIFTTYVKTFAAQHIKDDERYLPLTKTPVGLAPAPVNGTNGTATTNGNTNGIKVEEPAVKFLPTLPTPRARSAFVALSGLGDDFTTIEDLCTSTREGVFLEAAVIPHLELHPDETKTPLNSYLLDFFMHGSIVPLEEANGIRKSDVWFVLNDFSMVLATIVTSLALHLGLGSDADPEMLDVMGSGDAAENEEDAEVAAASIAEPTATNNSASGSTQPAFVKKKKVVEDWDAGEDALVAEEEYLKGEGLNGTGATDDEEYDKLMNVYKAFRKLKTEFDEKFRVIWA
ncbi:related to SKI2-antiviral protein and putative helicase [Rhynchosporium graminicola]|uniref:Related to SKI2-antiviral protein and putative helicase n=1 Tax=Rhynchosporium graminicola TaxID=2792576 RepID=A0A1E1JR68_9HELO|nr:related to SKI2-antiviral protein and putative helicase [Rhynchosporium commune]